MSPLPPNADPKAEAAAVGPGVWLPLQALRRLELGPRQWLGLLELAAANQPPVDARLASGAQLLAEASEAEATALQETIETCAWPEALKGVEALRLKLERLTRARPAMAEALGARYREVLGRFAAAVLKGLPTEEGMSAEDLLEPAELCWQVAERLERARALPCTAPAWVEVVERQIVQRGALHWRHLSGHRQEAGERCLELFLRLAQLSDPLPPWVEKEARRLLSARLAVMGPLEEAPVEELLRLTDWLGRLPLPADRQGQMAMALGRARLSLELLEGRPLPVPAEPDAQVAEHSAVDDRAGEPAPQEVPAEERLELVVEPEAPPLAPGRLNLAPFLDGDVDGVKDAFAAFCLQEGIDVALAAPPARHPAESLLRSLGQLPPAQRQLGPEAWAVLGAAAALWQERLGEGVAPLPAPDALEGLWLEPEERETELLLALLQRRGDVEEALLELRREHHHAAFWRPRPERGWSRRGRLLQTLIAFHREGGFYAAAASPLASLDHWGEAALSCLAEGRIWFDEPYALGGWLALAAQLGEGSAPAGGLMQSPLGEPLRQRLAGQEVVYVGAQAAAVREAHAKGRSSGAAGPFGLRCLEPPASRYPARPASGFEESLAALVEQVDALQRDRPFALLLADGGAYRLPLCLAIHRRHGIAAIAAAGNLARWLGV